MSVSILFFLCSGFSLAENLFSPYLFFRAREFFKVLYMASSRVSEVESRKIDARCSEVPGETNQGVRRFQ